MNVKEVAVTAEITDRMTGEKHNETCTLHLIQTGQSGHQIVARASGCFTGFESFPVNSNTAKNGFPQGWYACVGRKWEYDTLFIPSAEMQRALEALNIKSLFENN